MAMSHGVHVAAVGLGSNVGDRRAHIEAAFAGLSRLPGTRLVRRSGVIETEPMGPAGQGPYLNAAALIETTLAPRELLLAMLELERSRGRERRTSERWGPRTLDMDLLLFDDLMIDEPGLKVPHPRLHERRFVLAPLSEIAPDARVPGQGASVRELYARLGAEGAA